MIIRWKLSLCALFFVQMMLAHTWTTTPAGALQRCYKLHTTSRHCSYWRLQQTKRTEDLIPDFELLLPPKTCDTDRMSATDLAYLGDVVYELFIRSRTVWPPKRTSDLQKQVVALVRGESCHTHPILPKVANFALILSITLFPIDCNQCHSRTPISIAGSTEGRV